MRDGKEQWQTEMWWIRRAEKRSSEHFKERIRARKATEKDIETVIRTGEIIQGHAPRRYKDGSNPDPVRVILGYGEKGQPLHLVVALRRRQGEVVLVTVYHPNPEYWKSDLKTLRWR
jgi:hypothetical protein